MWNYVNVAHGAARTHIQAPEASVGGPGTACWRFTADDVVLTEIHGAFDEPGVFHGREAAVSHWTELAHLLAERKSAAKL